MYISRGPGSQTSFASSADATSAGTPSHQNDLQKLQQLIERSKTATGTLDRQAEAAIMAVLAQPPCYSIEKMWPISAIARARLAGRITPRVVRQQDLVTSALARTP